MKRVVIAAPASGHGKTTVATGLLAALRVRGHRPAGFKVGPDYIDPSYHALACGRPGRNLDPVMVGEGLVGPLFAHGMAGADVAVIEGVMGLYDGRGATEEGSTAHVAHLLDAPVVMVVDASSQSRSIAALLHGFRSFPGAPRIAGVILNRVGSDRHEALLREACEEVGMPVLGAIQRLAAVAAPSRHLGLVPAAERSAEALAGVEAQAALLDPLAEAVMAVAATAPPLSVEPWSAPVAPPTGRVIAVAGGPAFTFGYAETTELLTAAGATVVTFNPLRDEKLPDGTSGLVVGGGFPEVYAGELSANEPLRRAVAALAASGAPVAAECAGLLWLARSLDGAPMCGVIDAEARMTPRLTLGYRDAVAATDSWLGPAGTRLTGHEFHRTTVEPGAGASPAWYRREGPEGFVQGGVHASYLHLHWAGMPDIAGRLAGSVLT
ncbi:cobyrinate a,c-diamide synthase [Longispora albida]|uniref:cobyrinate a,c-diamide synthase n=1 Tax=Longispora albida TaxID=203523 RepID=UPI000377F4AD|nr:cobyrinate a,c-diamide synthase [Longispora albida]